MNLDGFGAIAADGQTGACTGPPCASVDAVFPGRVRIFQAHIDHAVVGVIHTANRLSGLVNVDSRRCNEGVNGELRGGRLAGIARCIKALHLHGESTLAQGRDIGGQQVQLPTHAIGAHSHRMTKAWEGGGLAVFTDKLHQRIGAHGHDTCEQHAACGGRLGFVDDVVTRNRQRQCGRCGCHCVHREGQRRCLRCVTRGIGGDNDQGVSALTQAVHILFIELQRPVGRANRLTAIDVQSPGQRAVAVENLHLNRGTDFARARQGQGCSFCGVDHSV